MRYDQVARVCERKDDRNHFAETIVSQLVARHGWAEMGRRIPVRCFLHDPNVKSSLTFLRKTPWARRKVEGWFMAELE